MEIAFGLIIIMLIIGMVVGIIDAIIMWSEGASGIEIINELTYPIRDLLNIEADFVF